MTFEVFPIVLEFNRNQIVAEYVWQIYISRKTIPFDSGDESEVYL